jgi:steroid Delta-isomerase
MHGRPFFARRILLSLTLAVVLGLAATGTSEAQAFDPEQKVRNYFAILSDPALTGLGDIFAPNAVLEDPVGPPPNYGRKAVVEYLTNLRSLFSEIHFEVPRVFVVTPNEAGAIWIAHAVAAGSGQEIEVHGMAVFTFNDQGEIRSLREWWELVDLLSQL